MSLLAPFKRLIGLTSQQNSQHLNSARICGLQHILPSQEQLFGAIRESGIADGLPIVIGKLYSTVRNALPPENYLAHEPLEIIYDRGNFEGAFKASLKPFCERQGITVSQKSKQPVVILDDGGFVSGFLSTYFLERGCPVIIIEQTTSGLRYARTYSCPVVSVASSVLKREVESVLIADSIVRAIIARSILPGKHENWAIAGFGAVGAALCRALRAIHVRRVFVYDRDAQLRLAASNEGFEVVEDARTLVEKADILFGCTGEDFSKTVPRADVNRRKTDLVCASCGSSDFEFGSWMVDTGETCLHRRNGRSGGNGFADVSAEFATGSFRILSGGFPINLDRRLKSDPVEDFVLTRMLVFVGILQALDLAKDGRPQTNQIHAIRHDLEIAVHDVWFDAFPHRLSPEVTRRARKILMQS